ncbi:MAG: NAD(P)-dependent alcohol dehydrogenase [Planctomycetota bacterium]|nr:MAG: NAD(P)-dependent alcohol dehydrogenase [Planctomycetota bacterium]
MPQTVAAYAAQTATSPLAPASIDRRDPGPNDVQFEILYCGVCHSDLHTARGEWPGITFPVVPGHEIVGKVTKVGAEVKNFKPGDLAAVGCMVDSCRSCAHCKSGNEQFCTAPATFTYNSPDKHFPGKMTYGGYSKHIVVDEAFVLRVPTNLDLAGAAPLLCAGITTYSPLKHWKADEKRDGQPKKVGIVGLGGLGHMGLKFAHAFGCHTVLFTTSPGKAEDAKRLGADEVVISKNESEMARHAGSFDFILDTVAASHNLDAYTTLLRVDGTLCLLGVPENPHPSPQVFPLIFGRRSIAGSLIGGIAETQEMLDFCAKHNITSDIELIDIKDINTAYERMLKSDVKYRFVIDMATLS